MILFLIFSKKEAGLASRNIVCKFLSTLSISVYWILLKQFAIFIRLWLIDLFMNEWTKNLPYIEQIAPKYEGTTTTNNNNNNTLFTFPLQGLSN